MLKYVQVSPYRSSSALGGLRRGGEGGCDHHSPSLSSPSTPSTRMSSASSHGYTSSSSSGSSSGVGAGGRGSGGRADSVSLNSSMSCSSLSQDPLSSRSSSSTSLHDAAPKVASLPPSTNTNSNTNLKVREAEDRGATTTVRVWVRCLMQQMEYKTVCIAYATTCRQLVQSLLSKFRMKHRDPNLFYLTLEVTVRKTGGIMRTTLTLEDDSRPAELQSCHPRGDSRLALKMRPGGLVRVYDGALVPGSQYKSLLVSDRTTCLELVKLVLLCNNILDNINNYSLFEVRRNDGRERKLHQDERPLRVTSRWTCRDHACLVVRHTPSPAPAHAHITPLNTLRASLIRSSVRKVSGSTKLEGGDSAAPSSLPCDALLPSTTITISPNGASTVIINTPNFNNLNINKSYTTLTDNAGTEKEEEEEEEEARPIPPQRNRRPKPPLRAAVRRQLPWTQSVDLVETPVDDEDDDDIHSSVRTRRAHSYNDYENYFYI